ncbi:MAG: hypothetical protein K0R98_1231 [Rickettsiaceae bacterium]|nr:hypothetical protein [Rickettsiaceae bacterium]
MPLIMTLNERFFYKNIEKIASRNEDAILLKELINFDWDKVCYYTPYSPSEEVTYLDFYKANKKIKTIYGFQRKFIEMFGKQTSFGSSILKENCVNNEVKIYLDKTGEFFLINLTY